MSLKRNPPLPSVYPIEAAALPERSIREGRYQVSFARTAEELDEVLSLRFEVFNLELGEGLDSSYETGRDEDAFDAVCHHLLVRDLESGAVVGCYRLQTAAMARGRLGFYSATEFDLSGLGDSVVDRAVELGRACVARSHRSTQVLFLLWKGLALYVANAGKRYLFGCSSLTSQDPEEGWAMASYLDRAGHLHPELEVQPLPEYRCEPVGAVERRFDRQDLPALFRIYLRHGAKVCSPPAVDRRFKTIDFLVLFDVEAMPRRMFKMFFG